jgi:hypothetical protein
MNGAPTMEAITTEMGFDSFWFIVYFQPKEFALILDHMRFKFMTVRLPARAIKSPVVVQTIGGGIRHEQRVMRVIVREPICCVNAGSVPAKSAVSQRR